MIAPTGGSRDDGPLLTLLAEPTYTGKRNEHGYPPLVRGGQGRSDARTVVTVTIIGYVAALAFGVMIGSML